MKAQRKCGVTIQSMEKSITKNVRKCHDKEAEQKHLIVSITNDNSRAANYCYASVRTIQQ
jgi:hypothetical protein